MYRRIILFALILSIVTVIAACNDDDNDVQEKPDVFELLVEYENPDITIKQYLGPTTLQEDLDAFIDWLKEQGFETSTADMDFAFYGFTVQRLFESDDMILGLNILLGDSTTILTTLQAEKQQTFDTLPDGYPEHSHMFEPSELQPELFMPTYPPAITHYFPMTGDPELARFHSYYTMADLETLYDYYETILTAEGYSIDYEEFHEEDHFYIEASKDDRHIFIVVDQYDGVDYVQVEVDESVGFR